jgi:hypothetical protein
MVEFPEGPRVLRICGKEDGGVGKDTNVVRRRLAARREDCFARLEDDVTELYALHSVGADEILALVHAVIERESRSAEGTIPADHPLNP